jgi:hypothetical protein
MRIDITRDITAPQRGHYSSAALGTNCATQVALHKVNMHQQFLRDWLQMIKLRNRWTFDELWRVREECSAALATRRKCLVEYCPHGTSNKQSLRNLLAFNVLVRKFHRGKKTLSL